MEKRTIILPMMFLLIAVQPTGTRAQEECLLPALGAGGTITTVEVPGCQEENSCDLLIPVVGTDGAVTYAQMPGCETENPCDLLIPVVGTDGAVTYAQMPGCEVEAPHVSPPQPTAQSQESRRASGGGRRRSNGSPPNSRIHDTAQTEQANASTPTTNAQWQQRSRQAAYAAPLHGAAPERSIPTTGPAVGTILALSTLGTVLAVRARRRPNLS